MAQELCWSCSSDMTGTEKECIFPCQQDIHCLLFCLNLLAMDLLKCLYEREPFEEEFFTPCFSVMKGREQKILDCSLRLCWVLPALSPLWLAVDKLLQLVLFCRNALQESQASG